MKISNLLFKAILIITFNLLVVFTNAQSLKQPYLESRSAEKIKINGLEFKDLNKNGLLDKYEDWRLSAKIRALDLVSKMTIEEKAGFMLISTSRMKGDWSFEPNAPKEEISSNFNEKDLVQSINMFSRQPLPVPIVSAAGTTKAVHEYHQRHFILRANTKAEIIAEWSNNLQSLCEATRLGIPAIVASNPRNHVTTDASAGLSVGLTPFSKWPGELGLAATRDIKLVKEFAQIAAQEWCAVGLRKGYMYMADLATEPRWQRIEGTFGENADLSAQMISAIVSGFQGTKLNSKSVAMTTKHFPGGGPQVDGHDPHFEWGKDQHYPGKMFEYHLKPFIAAIKAGTSAIMPYYAKPVGTTYEEIAFAYNKGILQDLLRKKLGFNGIINSDTGPIEMMPWGVEKLTLHQRYQKAIECGVDIFSGTADPTILLETIQKGLVSESRINESVIRLLIEKFDLGLFENPYVNVAKAGQMVGNPEFQKKADLAQRKSIVLLKNDKKLLPLKPKTKVYFETNYSSRSAQNSISVYHSVSDTWGLEFVDRAEQADVIIAWLIPTSGGLFSLKNEPIDITLKKNNINVDHINSLKKTKPTITVINFTSPWVIEEIYNEDLHTLLATFGTSPEALLDILTAKQKPTGKMPITIPLNSRVVLENQSDVPGYLKSKAYALFKYGDGLTY